MMTKNLIYMIDFLSNQNFTTEHFKLLKIKGILFKISGFSSFLSKLSYSRFFKVKVQP